MKSERLFYLRRMNAWPPAARRRRRAAPAADERRRRQAPKPGRRRPMRAPQGTPQRYRLRYTKLGRVAFLGHLDLVRHLPRIFRRAGLELFYSAGFHPKPELSFGPALGLGIPSLGELVDVTLIDDVDAGRAAAPAGAASRSTASSSWTRRAWATTIGRSARVIAEAEYAARLPDGVDRRGGVRARRRHDAAAGACATSREGDRPHDRRAHRRLLVRRAPWERRRRAPAGWTGDGGQMVSFRIAVQPRGERAARSRRCRALFGDDVAGRDVARLAAARTRSPAALRRAHPDRAARRPRAS